MVYLVIGSPCLIDQQSLDMISDYQFKKNDFHCGKEEIDPGITGNRFGQCRGILKCLQR